MNDLNEIDRRDFFRTKNLIDESHLLNCWSIDRNLIENDRCLFNDSKIENDDHCLINWNDENRCLID
jgi:hypothetical protein